MKWWGWGTCTVRKRDLVTANKRPPTRQEVTYMPRAEFAWRCDGVHSTLRGPRLFSQWMTACFSETGASKSPLAGLWKIIMACQEATTLSKDDVASQTIAGSGRIWDRPSKAWISTCAEAVLSGNPRHNEGKEKKTTKRHCSAGWGLPSSLSTKARKEPTRPGNHTTQETVCAPDSLIYKMGITVLKIKWWTEPPSATCLAQTTYWGISCYTSDCSCSSWDNSLLENLASNIGKVDNPHSSKLPQRIYSKIKNQVSGLGQRRERSVRGYCSNHVNQHQVTVNIRKLYTGCSFARKYTFRSGTADL